MTSQTCAADLAALDALLAPIPGRDFLDHHWQRKPLHVERADARFYDDLLTIDDVDRLLASVSLPVAHVNLGQSAVGIPVTDYSDGVHVRTPDVLRLHRAGNTIILRSMHLWLPKLRSLCEDMEQIFLCDAQANIYMTPAGTRSSFPHWDAHDILVIQVAGSKRWMLHENPLELPLRTFEFDRHRHAIGPETGEIHLGAGEIAYIPRGLAHNPIATGYSVHIALGIKVNTWADVMANVCSQLFLGSKACREALPIDRGRSRFDRAAGASRFRALLGEIDLARMEEALRALEAVHDGRGRTRTAGALASIARDEDLDLDSAIAIPDGGGVTISDEGDACDVVVNGVRLRLDGGLKAAFEVLNRSPRTRVGDIPAASDALRLALAQKLLEEGCVVAVP